MHRSALRRPGATALALAAVLLATGCGADDPDEDASAAGTPPALIGSPTTPGNVADASVSASPQDSSDVAAGKRTPAPKAAPVTFATLMERVSASFVEGGTATVEMTSQGAGVEMVQRGVIDYRQSPVALRMTMDMPEGSPGTEGVTSTEVIVVDNVVYTSMGEGPEPAYLKMPLGEDADAMLDISQFDPVKALEQYAGAVQGVRTLGEKKFGKETLTGYEATIESAKISRVLPSAPNMPRTYPYVLWFDSGDRVRRVVVDLGELGSSTMSYSDWGRAAAIAAPPASQVQEMPEVPEMPAR